MLNWNLDVKSSALLIIDVQNDFTDLKGHFATTRGVDVRRIRRIITPLKRLIETCKEAGIFVVWLQSIRTEDDCERNRHEILAKRFMGDWLGGPRKDTWGSKIIPEISPSEGDQIIQKLRNSAFYRTDLEKILRGKGTQTLFFCGIATNVCVESSLRDAYFRDFDVILVRDCCSAPKKSAHLGTIRSVEDNYGAVIESKDLVHKIRNSE